MTLTRELVYGRNAARELYRGPRQVLETWVTERAATQIPWLDSGPRPQVKPERVLSEAAGTRDHQGVVAWCEPFRYADAYELAKHEAPLLVCLDQVTDPHNLGAVVRSAEGVGATGVVVPAHGSVRVTPGGVPRVGRRRRARPGRGRAEPRAVPRGREVRTTCGRTPPTPRARWRCGTRISPAVSRSSSGAEGKGVRPLVRRTCDATVSIPLAGKVGSLNVSVAAAVLLFEARRQRGAADG